VPSPTAGDDVEQSKNRHNRSYGTGTIKKRGEYYWIQYYRRGKRYRESSRSAMHADAVNLLHQRLDEIKARGRRNHLQPTSFGDLVDLLCSNYEQKQRKSLKRALQCVVHLREKFGRDPVEEITYDHMSEYVSERLAGTIGGRPAARSTVRQELAILGRMFTLAVMAKRLHSRPSVPTVEFDNVRTGFFEDAEIDRVIELLPAYLQPLVRFLAVSGWRRSEATGLKWADVDWNEGTVRLAGARTKNGQPRVLPFSASPTLVGVLRAQKEAAQALRLTVGQIVSHVFHRDGKPVADFRHAWTRACREAGLPGRLVHDLRRSAVRRFEQRGIPRSVAMQITGHLTESIYKRYAVTSTADVAAALAKVDSGAVSAEIGTKPPQSEPSGDDDRPSERA
jgi:integrase